MSGSRRRLARAALAARSLALGSATAQGLLLAAALAVGCGDAPAPPPTPAQSERAPGPHEVAVLQIRDLGAIEIELLPELAPRTVAAFKQLAAEGHYDGTSFHRVLPELLIQGGDPNTKNADPRDDGAGGSDPPLPDEFSAWPQRRGTVSLAHQGHPNTAGSQFFVLVGDAPNLDGSYTAFGHVVAGMRVVDAIAALEIDKFGRYGPPDRPYPVSAVVESVTIRPAPAALDPAEPAG